MPGVYLSYPFCAQKCTYCNFASGVFPKSISENYPQALLAELGAAEWQWTPETVYWGGGTPSQMDPEILQSIHNSIPGRPWREATLEAAPGGITPDKARAWVEAGINRVSLGVQSFVTAELVRTGRRHTTEIVACEVEELRAAGIRNVNVDLIAGLPGQTLSSWKESLDWVARLGVPHVSIYMLEVDEDSRLGSELLALGKRYGAPEVPCEDDIATMYEIAVERLAGMGIPRYEISNFARPGFESVHNLKYWKREPYLGFGADAHSFDGRLRWQNAESVTDYLAQGNQLQPKTPADNESEHFFLGLRLTRGVPMPAIPHPAIERFLKEDLLEESQGRLRLTSRGVLLSNEVFGEFLP